MTNILFTPSVASRLYEIIANAVAISYLRSNSPSALRQVKFRLDMNEAFEICITQILSKVHLYDTQQNNLEGWIYRVCHNKCRDIQRKKKLQIIPIDESHQQQQEQNYEDQLTTELEWEKRYQIVEKSLDQVNPMSKNVILFRFKNELTHQEIANRTGLKLSSVGQTLHRAKKELNIILNRNLQKAA